MGNHNSGRRAKPTALKLLEGVRKDRVNLNEPTPPVGAIAKPELSEYASPVWDELAPLAIAMGTLTPADVAAFRTLCELSATLRLESARKGQKKFSAMAEGKTATALRPFYEMFGLNPTGRARIRLPNADAKPKGPAGLRDFARLKGGLGA